MRRRNTGSRCRPIRSEVQGRAQPGRSLAVSSGFPYFNPTPNESASFAPGDAVFPEPVIRRINVEISTKQTHQRKLRAARCTPLISSKQRRHCRSRHWRTQRQADRFDDPFKYKNTVQHVLGCVCETPEDHTYRDGQKSSPCLFQTSTLTPSNFGGLYVYFLQGGVGMVTVWR